MKLNYTRGKVRFLHKVKKYPISFWELLDDWLKLMGEVKRLRKGLREVAKMIEHETDRTLIYNYCMQVVEPDLEKGADE